MPTSLPRWTPVLAAVMLHGGRATVTLPSEPPCGEELLVAGFPAAALARARRDPPRSVFDPARALGRPDPNELAGAIDLPAYLRAVLARDYGSAHYGGAALGLRNFGDVLRWLRAQGTSHVALQARLAELARRAPAIHRELAWLLLELTSQGRFRKPDWKARDDHPRDGFLSLAGWWPWPGSYARAWPRLNGEPVQAYQVAALALLDGAAEDGCAALACLARAERRFEEYGHWRGLDRGRPRAALVPGTLRLDVSAGETSYALHLRLGSIFLPDFDLAVRERSTAEGYEREVHALGDAWRFFAGREEWWPVRGSDGAFVGLLGVGTFAFTALPGDVIARVLLGNAKRCAESR